METRLRHSVYLRCAYRATFATLRPNRPPPPSRDDARSRLSKQSQRRNRPRVQSSVNLSQEESAEKLTLSDALRETKKEDNSLLSPVHVPEDPHGVLNEQHPAAGILRNSSIVVQRQLELMNVMIGFEQANKYVILGPQGDHIGFMAEQDDSMGRTMARQMLSTHRSFSTYVFDKHEKEVLRVRGAATASTFHRPFSWISSRIGVYDPIEVATSSRSRSSDIVASTTGSLTATSSQLSPLASPMRVIGEAQQQWAPLRRKYNLFLYRQTPNLEKNTATRRISSGDLPPSSSQQLQISEVTQGVSPGEYNQFAYVDEPFLSWDFSLLSADARKIGSVNRNWGGFGRELFTDTGVYALRMDAAERIQDQSSSTGQTNLATLHKGDGGMTLDQRAVMLATAVTIDFDYFSRHSGAGGGTGWIPLWFPWGGGEAAAAGGAAEEGSIIRNAEYRGTDKIGEGAAVGAGSMAGYEAMQRGADRNVADDAPPIWGEEFKEEFLEPGEGDQDPDEKKNDYWPVNSDIGGGTYGGRGGSRENVGDGGSSGDGGRGIDGGDGGGFDVGGGGDFIDF
ncbi:MAG: hypothetical protein Q9209_002131 [Squamulea sp. 1 TL-2023]